ncbi:MAG: T9SS type A sorting domain-containing protein [Candidatus Cloacimonetes bacterium]|nr:T9SS type A sorting domain-containing protein [Candidatus Cloacimonadota bacterium]
MKKLLILLTMTFISSLCFAQADATVGFDTETAPFTFYGILDNAGSPCPDGWAVQVILDGGDAVMSPMAGGLPTGDDIIPLNANTTFAINTGAWGQPGGIYTLFTYVFENPIGSPEPQASYVNTDEYIFLRVYNNTDPALADLYCETTIMQTATAGQTGFLHWTTWTDGTGNWLETDPSAGEPIPPGGGTVGGGATWGNNTITFLSGNSGTIDMTFDPANPPPGLAGEITTPQNISWIFDLTGANITVWPVTLYFEWPFDASIDFNSSALVHYTDDGVNPADWYALVAGHPTLLVHPDNVGQDHNFSWDFGSDPQWVQFDTWALSDWGMDGDEPLPVTLTNFAAEFVANNLTILWTTQSENSNMGWNIYRGESNSALEEDNTILINVEMIEGAGTTSEPTNYEFIDEYPVVVNNTYWYWLESVSYSNDTGIYGPISLTIPIGETPPPLPEITLLKGNYPNPFNPTTFIQFDIKEGETGELTIYNIRGQIVESKTFDAGAYNYKWDSMDNASGVYFYRLRSESYSEFKKMMILK